MGGLQCDGDDDGDDSKEHKKGAKDSNKDNNDNNNDIYIYIKVFPVSIGGCGCFVIGTFF